ncbi:MAG: 6-carboxytetrahydropterin synthase [Bacteroidaceae bacterium]|nr:6-carboxytetrahydropterin synthase [Bacteroidaceae bacterium]
MFYVSKTLEISYAHSLSLNYPSKCSGLHGHNARITVHCAAEELNENGMVVDFMHIKEVVMRLDHKNLNDLFPFNTTAENVARWICEQIPTCYKVEFCESEGNTAIYTSDTAPAHHG